MSEQRKRGSGGRGQRGPRRPQMNRRGPAPPTRSKSGVLPKQFAEPPPQQYYRSAINTNTLSSDSGSGRGRGYAGVVAGNMMMQQQQHQQQQQQQRQMKCAQTLHERNPSFSDSSSIMNLPARTRSTPPTTAEQQQAEQAYLFTPHKSKVGMSHSFIPVPTRSLAHAQQQQHTIQQHYQQHMMMTGQHQAGFPHMAMQPGLHSFDPGMVGGGGGHSVANYLPPNSMFLSNSGAPMHIPHQQHPGHMNQQHHHHQQQQQHYHNQQPQHQRAAPVKRVSRALPIMNPNTGKQISVDSPSDTVSKSSHAQSSTNTTRISPSEKHIKTPVPEHMNMQKNVALDDASTVNFGTSHHHDAVVSKPHTPVEQENVKELGTNATAENLEVAPSSGSQDHATVVQKSSSAHSPPVSSDTVDSTVEQHCNTDPSCEETSIEKDMNLTNTISPVKQPDSLHQSSSLIANNRNENVSVNETCLEANEKVVTAIESNASQPAKSKTDDKSTDDDVKMAECCIYSIEELMALQPEFLEPPSSLSSDNDCFKSTTISRAKSAFSLNNSYQESSGNHYGHQTRESSFRPAPSMHMRTARDYGHGGQNSHFRKSKSSIIDARGDDPRRRTSTQIDSRSNYHINGGRERDRSNNSNGNGNRRRQSIRSNGPYGSYEEHSSSEPVSSLIQSDNRWQPVKVADSFLRLQRELKGLLNKLTVERFKHISSLFVEAVKKTVTKASALTTVVELIFDKATSEPAFSKMYSELCVALSKSTSDVVNDVENSSEPKTSFRHILLEQCRGEFLRGVQPITKTDSMDEDEYTLLTLQQKQRFLGNIRFIGELFMHSMLAESKVHNIIKYLLRDFNHPLAEDVEATCNFFTTVGKKMDHEKSAEHMNTYFNRLEQLSKHKELPSRIKFLIKDVIELRESRWLPRRKKEEAKTIKEIHKEARRELAEKDLRSSQRRSLRFDSRCPDRVREQDRRATVHSFQSINARPTRLVHTRAESSDVRRSHTHINEQTERYSQVIADKRSQSPDNGERRPTATTVLLRTATAPAASLTIDSPRSMEDSEQKRNMVKSIDKLIREMSYFNGDTKELLQKVPQTKNESDRLLIVSHCLTKGLEGNDTTRSDCIKMITILSRSSVLTDSDILNAVQDQVERISDIIIDIPFALKHLSSIVAALIISGELQISSLYKLATLTAITDGMCARFIACILNTIQRFQGIENTKALVMHQQFDISIFLHKPMGDKLEVFVEREKLSEIFPEVALRTQLLQLTPLNPDAVLNWLSGINLTNTMCSFFLRTLLEAPLVLAHTDSSTLSANLAQHARVLSALQAHTDPSFAIIFEAQKVLHWIVASKELMLHTITTLLQLDIIEPNTVQIWRNEAPNIMGKMNMLTAISTLVEDL